MARSAIIPFFIVAPSIGRKMQKILVNLPRHIKVWIELAFDAVALTCAILLTAGKMGVSFASISQWDYLLSMAIAILISLSIFYCIGIYKSLLRFTSTRTILAMLIGNLVAASLFTAQTYFIADQILFSAFTDFFFFATSFTMAGRLFARAYLRLCASSEKEPVLIFGAQDLGRQLLISLQESGEFKPVALIDDAPDLQGTSISGVYVRPTKDLQKIVVEKEIKNIFLAMSEVPRSVQRELSTLLSATPVEIQCVPAASDISSGRAKITDLQDFKIEDLLGRRPIKANQQLLNATTYGKSVLVTGAGGSIGSEISRQVFAQNPKRVVLFDVSEFALYSIEQELLEAKASTDSKTEIVSVLGSVCDKKLLQETFDLHRITTVFHAAAYKHVPILEENVFAAIENNVFGTLRVLETAIDADTEFFTLVSTDKAVRPTNVMGASKRLAELVCQAFAASQNRTKVSMVRFGNVLDSSGSVIPRFRKQIERGGPVTLTHRKITRYFMTIPEASQLVIQSSGMANGGEVFLLDMGKPIKILELAKSMIRLSGYKPVTSWEPQSENAEGVSEIEIVCTGLRPGEKLFEELLIDSNAMQTGHQQIKRAQEQSVSANDLRKILKDLFKFSRERDADGMKAYLVSIPLGYSVPISQDNQKSLMRA